jgi:hypothetical protein
MSFRILNFYRKGIITTATGEMLTLSLILLPLRVECAGLMMAD